MAGGALAAGLLLPGAAAGADWTVTPSVSLAETYTDNVTLATADREEEYITNIRPGIDVHADGRRLKLDLNYALDNLIYARESARNNAFHQLRSEASLEAVPELLVVDARGAIGQQIIDAEENVALDNLTPGNRADVTSFSAGPTLRHEFGGLVATKVAYGYGEVHYAGTEQISDSTHRQLGVSLKSGRRLTRFTWEGNYNKSDMVRSGGSDSMRENGNLALRYRLGGGFSLLARGGVENNDIATTRTIVDGSYWSAGFVWMPAPYLTVDSTAGDRYRDINLSWSPVPRSTLDLGYREFEVGLNPGSSWSGALRHRTRRSTWEFGYSEQVTSMQFLQNTGDYREVPFLDFATGKYGVVKFPIFTLTDEEFLSKRAFGEVTYKTGRSTIGFGADHETREFELSRDEERVDGANVSWNWRFGTRTRLLLRADRQRRDIPADGRRDDYWLAGAGLTKDVRADLATYLEYRYAARASSAAAGDYHENRVTAGITRKF